MRISTNTMFQSGINKITTLQSEQVRLQQQISTGRRIASPSEDPVASAHALELSYAQGINAKFADTRQTAQLKLNTLESSLTSVTTLLTSVQSSLVGAGNATYSDQERAFIGSELNGSLEMLIGLANTKDASGNYLYAGYQTSAQPFVASTATAPNGSTTTTSAAYMGDSNQQSLQVESTRLMSVSVTGDSVFQANGSNDVFTALGDIVTLLNTPITDDTSRATFNAGLATAISKMRSATDNVLNVRASIGNKLNEIDSLDLSGSDRDLQYSTSLSNLQDLDYAKALSDQAKNQTILEAALKSFTATTSLSLFKLI